MLRESRRGDPHVSAAQSREQYYKVVLNITRVCSLLYMVVVSKSGTQLLCEFVFLVQLKNKLQLLTLGIGGVGVLSAYFSYSAEIAARYLSMLNAYVSETCQQFVH